MAAPYRRRVKLPPTHWNGEDGKVIKITKQGKLVVVKTLQPHSEAPIGAKRGQVKGFTKQSRLRLLSTIATLDWEGNRPCLFVTLTFPNRENPFTKYDLNYYRFAFHRSLEQLLGKKIPLLWRIEWQDRKSGPHAGRPYPHFHLIVFREHFIPHNQINALWAKALGVEEYVRTETKGMVNDQQAVFYVAKYCAKESGSLVNDAYLNNVPCHRHWGIMRKGELVFSPKQEIRLYKGVWFNELLEIVRQIWKDADPSAESFRLLGENADAVAELIFEEWRRQQRGG